MLLTKPQTSATVIDQHEGSIDKCSGWMDLCTDLQLYVMSVASLVSVVNIGYTSRYNFNVAQGFIKDKIYALLVAFSLPPAATLDTMKKLKAVISGSLVLALIEPGLFTPGDIDIYIPFGNMIAFVQFLDGLGGFKEVAKEDELPPYEPSGRRVTCVHQTKYFQHQASGALVNLVETRTKTPTVAVFMFHSSIVMNYITWNTVVCAYPNLTCQHKALQNTDLDTPTDRTVKCFLKYIRRGFDFLNHANEWDDKHECRRSPYCGRSTRRVDDRSTMRIGFSGELESANDLVDDSISWSLATKAPCKHNATLIQTQGHVTARNYVARVSER
ncbi:hypothetical protein MD484_g4134, partial [Candolleomyces efflorescens]